MSIQAGEAQKLQPGGACKRSQHSNSECVYESECSPAPRFAAESASAFEALSVHRVPVDACERPNVATVKWSKVGARSACAGQ
jgi:hypothetical protein